MVWAKTISCLTVIIATDNKVFWTEFELSLVEKRYVNHSDDIGWTNTVNSNPDFH